MKIELIEHCTGHATYVDGIDISDKEENILDKKGLLDVKRKVLSELSKNIHNIPNYKWLEIVEASLVDNTRFSIITEEGYQDICDQCGDWGSKTVYQSI